ncbi:MAG: hypothetical protein Hyperionvirus17_42 [Hyperionvirus sp.]|uniref:Uncharacterized protein n=1 Tax=Hyperionvirus sp. TaxID=2487770 RepID=A0A3G5AAK1_9VIRU|nr:MAG: hypothetical protein Hyperionvirus17_42 [Hyperionvirus sp.]
MRRANFRVSIGNIHGGGGGESVSGDEFSDSSREIELANIS